MKVAIVKMTNRLLFERLLKSFEMKECERFTKNCTLRQCFNCQKYEHISRHCKSAAACGICVMGHRTSDCDSTTTDKYKMCERCEVRGHTAWASNCKVRIEEKKKIDLARRNRMRLYFVRESQPTRSVFNFNTTSLTESETLPQG
jgi:hypothetical protein